MSEKAIIPTPKLPSGNVWAVIHHTHVLVSDVAIPETRKADIREWDKARNQALRNAQTCSEQTARWLAIADELAIQSANHVKT